ncbi:hypothetical protein [Euzebyella saccharophila]|uniref:Uncharacterized protein n=1 Tax=Euzebyella saccharophila TaxID=679664 RepID=A0ABV8JLU8_9FLAO|nr:hypothetical protein [Euzebyella saccharophila]
MKNNYSHILLFILCSLLGSLQLYAVTPPVSGSKDSLAHKTKDTTLQQQKKKQQLDYLQQLAALQSDRHAQITPLSSSKDTIPTITSEAGSKNSPSLGELEEATYRSFPTLDEKLAQNQNFNVVFTQRQPEFNAAFMAENYPKNPAVEKLIKNAKNAVEAVSKMGRFVEILTGNELLELPVGLKKTDQTSGNSVELAITEVEFTPNHALLKVWARMTVPEKGEVDDKKDRSIERQLFFGAENVKLSYEGGLSGDMKLVLLGNQAIPIQGDNWLLTLRGDIDLKTNSFSDQSFIEFDCSNLKGISLEGDLRVSRNVLLPINENGEYTCGNSRDNQYLKDMEDQVVDNKCYVGASFSVKSEGWNDLLINVDLPRFEVVGLTGWGFNLKNVVLDLSDSRSAPNLNLPREYNNIYSGADEKLWRGFYAEEVSGMLPQGIEDTKKSNGRVEFGAKDLVLDSQGVSGTFYGENVLKTGDGAAGKWAFTIEDVSISLSRNSLTGGSMGGDIAVPIFEKPMDYSGYIDQNGYGLEVGLQSNYETPVFLGEMQLAKNSSVAIDVKDGKVYPSANLTGELSIVGKIGQKEGEKSPSTQEAEDSGKGFNFPGIQFQELKLETEPGKKAISATSFGFTGDMKLMNFPASVENLQLVTPGNQVGLSFGLKINLDGDGSHATTSMDILGKLEESSKIQAWKFEKVKVDGVKVDYKKSGVHLTGGLQIMDEDPTYGNGFAGELSVDITKLNYKASAKAMFGSTTFRYWFVDIWSDSKESGSSKLPINSLAGGLSNKMKRITNGKTTEFNPSKAVYVPDANTGLGLRAGAGIGTNNSSSFSAKVFIEMEFNTHGGLNRIGFTGEGSLMGDDSYISPEAKLLENNKLLDKMSGFIEKNAGKAETFLKDNDFLGLSKNAIPKREVASSGRVGVFVGIEKDFVNDSFHGEFEVYIDLEGIRGGNEDNLAGRAVIHKDPQEWYIHVGTPETPISLTFDVKIAELNVQAYFMTGTKLPTAFPPRDEVVRILGADVAELNRQGKDGQFEAAKGFAFGLNFSYQYKYQYLIFYAYLEFGGGFDIMHAYYPDAKCVGRPGPIGNNGWYSMGQVYAYLEGEFGVEVDLAFIKGKFPIAYAGVAAMLRGQFPNPIYLNGYVGMRYEILGGLIKGNMRMKFEAGEECEFEGISDAIGVPIISDVVPREGDTDVSVYAAPQAIFTYPVNKDVEVNLEEGKRTFKIQLKEFTLTHEGKEIEGKFEWNEDHDAVTFISEKTLPSEKELIALVEVSFDEKINGAYKTLVKEGKPVVERKEIAFKTTKAPDHIPWEQVSYVYPVKDMKNFYPQEYTTGYVKPKRAPDYLFEGGYEMRAQFVSLLTNEGIRTPLRYDKQKGMVFFEIPELVPNSKYRLDLMVYPPGQEAPPEIFTEEKETVYDTEKVNTNWYDPGTDTQTERNDVNSTAVVSQKKATGIQMNDAAPKSILDMEFRSSQHASFKDKINSLEVIDNLTNNIFYFNANDSLDVYAKVQSLSIKVADYEAFDKPEIYADRYNPEPLIYAQAILKDDYYKKDILPIMYDRTGSDPIYPIDGIYVNRDENILGVPPIRSFYIGYEYKRDYENDPNSPWVKNRIPFIYNLPYQYYEDFIHLRGTLRNKYPNPSADPDIYEKYHLLLTKSFPAFRFNKSYQAELIYRTPGNLYSQGYKIKYVND